jgi:hypothetical protein
MTILKTSALKKSAMLLPRPEPFKVVPVPLLLPALPSSLRLTEAFLLPTVSALRGGEPPRLPPFVACDFGCSFRLLLFDGDNGGSGAVRLMLRFDSLAGGWWPFGTERDSSLWMT